MSERENLKEELIGCLINVFPSLSNRKLEIMVRERIDNILMYYQIERI